MSDEKGKTDPLKFEEIVIDHSIVKCQGCGHERSYHHTPWITSIQEFDAFTKSIEACACGATHCDISMHLVGENRT